MMTKTLALTKNNDIDFIYLQKELQNLLFKTLYT